MVATDAPVLFVLLPDILAVVTDGSCSFPWEKLDMPVVSVVVQVTRLIRPWSTPTTRLFSLLLVHRHCGIGNFLGL